MDDILDMLEAKDAGFNTKPATQQVRQGGNKKNDPIFEKNDWRGEKIDINSLHKSDKSVAVNLFVGDLMLPTEIHEKFLKIIRALVASGYKIRIVPDNDTAKVKDIEGIEGIYIETYTPWLGFKQAWGPRPPRDRGRGAPSEKAYNIAAESVRNFNTFPGVIRAFRATAVNVMLGYDCISPVSLLLCYTPSGEEQITRDINFKACGAVTNYIRIAAEANIPIFNIAKQESVARLSEWLKANN